MLRTGDRPKTVQHEICRVDWGNCFSNAPVTALSRVWPADPLLHSLPAHCHAIVILSLASLTMAEIGLGPIIHDASQMVNSIPVVIGIHILDLQLV